MIKQVHFNMFPTEYTTSMVIWPNLKDKLTHWMIDHTVIASLSNSHTVAYGYQK
jgi:hypothetical protein